MCKDCCEKGRKEVLEVRLGEGKGDGARGGGRKRGGEKGRCRQRVRECAVVQTLASYLKLVPAAE